MARGWDSVTYTLIVGGRHTRKCMPTDDLAMGETTLSRLKSTLVQLLNKSYPDGAMRIRISD